MTFEQYRRQCRRQGQRVEGGNDRRNGDGQRELLIELSAKPGNECRWHEHGAQHQRRRDDRPRHFGHGLVRGGDRFQAQFDVPFDVLHHHDGIVDHDTDRQHQAEQGQRVQRETEHMHDRKGADQRDRYGHQRDDRCAPGLQEQDHHQHHQDQCFEQRVNHCLDGAADEDRRVIDDAVVHAFREAFLELGHPCPYIVGDVDGVGAGTLEDRDGYRRLIIEQRAQRVLAGAQFDACNVLEASDFAIGTGAHDHVFELFLTDQTALSVDRHLKAGGIRGGRGAQLACGDLTVLFANRIDHVSGGQVA